jgi:hypothetical protein
VVDRVAEVVEALEPDETLHAVLDVNPRTALEPCCSARVGRLLVTPV